MSQQVVSQIIERTCEGCGVVVKYEVVNPSDDMITDMTRWYTVVREIADSESGRFVKMMVQACSLPCVNVAALKLEVIPSNAPDDIDLKTLRVNPDSTAN
jgi:hypothetical protein